MYKNIEKQAVLQLKDLVEYQTGQVVSKTLVQNDKVSMTIFSFDKGEEISTHAAGGDAMVTVLEGTGKFTVGGEVFLLHAGETLTSPFSRGTYLKRDFLCESVPALFFPRRFFHGRYILYA